MSMPRAAMAAMSREPWAVSREPWAASREPWAHSCPKPSSNPSVFRKRWTPRPTTPKQDREGRYPKRRAISFAQSSNTMRPSSTRKGSRLPTISWKSFPNTGRRFAWRASPCIAWGRRMMPSPWSKWVLWTTWGESLVRLQCEEILELERCHPLCLRRISKQHKSSEMYSHLVLWNSCSRGSLCPLRNHRLF